MLEKAPVSSGAFFFVSYPGYHQRMMRAENQWYVRFKGQTLGPLSTEEIKASLASGELRPEDRASSQNDFSWRAISEHPELKGFWKSPVASTDFLVPPSPKILWKKKRGEIPTLPEAEETPVIEIKVEEVRQDPVPVAATPTMAPAPELPIIKKESKRGRPKGIRNTRKKVEKKTEDLVSLARPSFESMQQPLLQSEETLSLLESFREWKHPSTAPSFATPAKEEVKSLPPTTFFLPELNPRTEQAPLNQKEPAETSTRIELKFSLSKRTAILTVATIFIFTLSFAFYASEKTRDLKDNHLPDPSSPTASPSTASDPISPLKAPTRPRRE